MLEDDKEWIRWIAAAPVPVEARGKWCNITVSDLPCLTAAIAVLTFSGASPAGQNCWVPLKTRAGKAFPGLVGEALVHVPSAAATVKIGILGRLEGSGRSRVSFAPMSQPMAACRLALRHRRALLQGVRRGGSVRWRSLRAALARSAAEPDLFEDYATWARLFDRSPDAPDAPGPGWPTIGAWVFQAAGAGAAALEASIAALGTQHPAIAHAVVADRNWRAALAALECDYVAILQAGEVPPRAMSTLAAAALARLGNPAMACADEDTLALDGVRSDPNFKPRPNHALMLSGTLTRGLWLVRRDVLAAAPDDLDASWAETFRLDLWLRLYEAGSADTPRIPRVLAHRRTDTSLAPADALAGVVERHLRRTGLPWRTNPGFPVRLCPAADAPCPPVSILVASTLSRDHAAACLPAILARTAYPDFEMVIAVAQPQPLSQAQAVQARRLQTDARVRVVWLAEPIFNYAAVNNRMAAMARGEILCLLNDDVEPIEGDWLHRLVSWLADPHVAASGARLLYPDRTIQHGGIVMGLGGLCNHAHRHLPADQPGYAWRAVLAQAASAVTGACLVVRRAAFEAVGGLDETYPAAFNDVDLCLRLGEAGDGVVYDGATSLWHRENATYGAAAAASARPDGAEGLRMARRWGQICRADPFHNPNLDRTPGREWRLAWPPRSRDIG